MVKATNAFARGAPIRGTQGVTGVFLTPALVFMPWRKLGYPIGVNGNPPSSAGTARSR